MAKSHPNCIDWPGRIGTHGYGVLYVDGTPWLAHRLAWRDANGEIPEGLWVLHHCDRRVCVNPEHLFLGTQTDNMADMHSKGRGAIGSRNGVAKLTEESVREIRERVAGGETQASLCEEFSVAPGTMSWLINRRTWRHV